jgi:hypothetical protein
MNVSVGRACDQSVQTAIYEGADDWRYKDRNKTEGKMILPDGTE